MVAEVTPFLAYSAKFGRKLITTQEVLKKSIPNKWWNKVPLPLPQVGISFGTTQDTKGGGLPLVNYS
jgi:hypothetical protein